MVYKGKKRQRGGVYKGSKRQRGGNLMKTGGKLAKKGKKQIGGSTINPRYTGYRNKGSAWGRRLGASVDRFYM